MSEFSNLDRVLLSTHSHVESFSHELAAHPEKVPSTQFKALASELDSAAHNLLKALKRASVPAFNDFFSKLQLSPDKKRHIIYKDCL